MKETELKLHPCYCGGEMKIKKVAQNGGMDGMYFDWELTCSKCGLTKMYAADGFYGRKYMTLEEVVDDWNKEKEEIIKSLGQQTCEDAISRQAVLDIDFHKLIHTTAKPAEMIRQKIEQLPPVNPQTKTGHWIKYCVPRCGEQHYQCTSCKYYINFGQWGEVYTKQFKYCPNCGAKMVEPQESEDEKCRIV